MALPKSLETRCSESLVALLEADATVAAEVNRIQAIELEDLALSGTDIDSPELWVSIARSQETRQASHTADHLVVLGVTAVIGRDDLVSPYYRSDLLAAVKRAIRAQEGGILYDIDDPAVPLTEALTAWETLRAGRFFDPQRILTATLLVQFETSIDELTGQPITGALS